MICYTTVREPDILRNVIVSEYVTFCLINKCFVKILFFIIDQISLRPDGMASRARFDPRGVVWRPLVWKNNHLLSMWYPYSILRSGKTCQRFYSTWSSGKTCQRFFRWISFFAIAAIIFCITWILGLHQEAIKKLFFGWRPDQWSRMTTFRFSNPSSCEWIHIES